MSHHGYERNIEIEVAELIDPKSVFDKVSGIPFVGNRVFAPLALQDKLKQCQDFMAQHNIHDAESFDALDLESIDLDA